MHITRFPILAQLYEQYLYGGHHHQAPPTNLFRSTYVQGRQLTEDRLLSWHSVATAPGVSEHSPGFAGPQPTFVRGDRLILVDSHGSHHTVFQDPALTQGRFSPDGSRLAYVLRPQDQDQLFLRQGDGDPAQPVAYTGTRILDLHFSPDGQELWLTSGQLQRMPLADRQTSPVPTTRPVTEFALAPDGQTLAILDDQRSLFHLDRKTGGESLLTRLADESDSPPPGRSTPMFSPDGSRVIYNLCQWNEDEDWGIRSGLWVVASHGGEPHEVEEEMIPPMAGLTRPEGLGAPLPWVQNRRSLLRVSARIPA